MVKKKVTKEDKEYASPFIWICLAWPVIGTIIFLIEHFLWGFGNYDPVVGVFLSLAFAPLGLFLWFITIYARFFHED